MTKLLSLRVVVAVDDAVDVAMLKPRLKALIEVGGTESLGDGIGEALRIHWGTVDVLRGIEPRGEVAARRTRGGKRPANSRQPDLVP